MYDLLYSTSKLVKQNSYTVYYEIHEVPFAIAELGQKCLEAAPILRFEPLNSCITVFNV